MSDNSTNNLQDVDKLANEFMLAYRAGKRPNIEEFVRQYPALAEKLEGLLRTLVILEQNVPGGDKSRNGGATLASPTSPSEIGDFLIIREIGRGGMGVVYEAIQQSLGRHVALKVLNHSGRMNESHLERFRLESRAAARLHHQHIVPVFGVGESGGVHYYAMQFIQGQSLDLVIEALRRLRKRSDGLTKPFSNDLRTLADSNSLLASGTADANVIEQPDTQGTNATTTNASSTSELSASQSECEYFRSVARVGLQIARALAYAHGEGILHRDVKPSNLLLDAKADVWITDFGLAKAEDSDGVTKTGDFVGTLRYMAPERLEGWSDRRSDIYGLGATLYELLTLEPLFEGESGGRLVDSILHESPAPPSKHDRLIPSDLETIVLTAIAKEPASRYHAADAMAEDLQRFLDDRPILARRSRSTERLVRWCRRNRAVSSLIGAVATLLIAAVMILAISNANIRRESAARAVALREKNVALQKAREAVDQLLVRVSEDKLFDVPQADPIRRGLLQDALRFYESFINLDEQDPSLQFQLAEVLRRLAFVEHSFAPPEAFELSNRGIQILDRLVRESPENYEFRFALAKACEEQCFFWEQRHTPESAKQSEVIGQRCLAIRRTLQAERPQVVQNTCNVLVRLGQIAGERGDATAATRYYQEAIDNARNILAKTPDNLDALGALNGSYAGISHDPQCVDREGMLKEALTSVEIQLRVRPNFSAARFQAAETKIDLACYCRDSGRTEDAIKLFQESWLGMATVCADRPNIAWAWKWSRMSLDNGVKVLQGLGRNNDAVQWIGQYRQWLTDVEPKLTDNPTVNGEYFASQEFIAQRLKSVGKADEADEVMLQANRRLQGLPNSSLSAQYFPDQLAGRANELCNQNKWQEAAAVYASLIDSAPDRPWTSTRKKLCRTAAQSPPLFTELQRLRPNEPTLWIGHAHDRALCSDWKAAAEDYGRVIEQRPVSDEWFEYAHVLLLIGDQDGYERLCKKFVARIDERSGAYDLYVAARTCSIGTTKSVEASKICDWADRSLNDRPPWKLFVAGLAYLRAGKFDQANKLFEEGTHEDWGAAQSENWFGEAIAEKQLGNDENARKCLTKGRELFKSVQPAQAGRPSPIGVPWDWMAMVLLSREAEQCVSHAANKKTSRSLSNGRCDSRLQNDCSNNQQACSAKASGPERPLGLRPQPKRGLKNISSLVPKEGVPWADSAIGPPA